MGAVADLFDRNGEGLIDWQEFIAALRPDWQERKPATDADKIHDEVKRLVMLCTCRQKFRVFQVGEGKYRVSIMENVNKHFYANKQMYVWLISTVWWQSETSSGKNSQKYRYGARWRRLGSTWWVPCEKWSMQRWVYQSEICVNIVTILMKSDIRK